MTSDDTPLVRTATEHGVATLTLDSPRNRNALSTPLVTRLRAELAAAATDPAVRVVVLDHAGPVFCSGADLVETEAACRSGTMPVAMLADLLADLWECPKPVVARVAGPTRAGGIGLVAAADLAICATEATFAFTEVRLGVIPAVISAVVLPRMGSRAATRLFLTGEVFDAAHAAAVGLVSEAVPATRLDRTVSRICQALVRGAPQALAGTKQLLRRPRAADLRAELAELSALSVGYFRSPDAQEGIAAFRDKRDPQWVLDTRR
ncbi:MAG: enoyl-CoA hydratase [Micromonosporaceae bacterium]|nr:enoyl-CoA hydratase [Micromonosporaceae bacterium]